jgi:hypothetical protein
MRTAPRFNFSSQSLRPDRSERVLMLLLCLFVCVLLSLILNALASGLSNALLQYRAKSFPSTTGKVLRSSVHTKWLGNKNPTPFYSAEIGYRYDVNGKAYLSDRFRFEHDQSDSDPSAANTLIASYPVGSQVTVFYDPYNPGRALLKPGLLAEDLYLFAPVGFAAFGLLALRFLFGWWRDHYIRSETGGVRIIAQPGCVRVRLSRYSPIMLGLVTLTLSSIAATIIVGGSKEKPSSMQEVLLGWAAVLTCSGTVFLAFRLRLNSGIDDLVIDHETAFLTLPRNFGRKRNDTVDLRNIMSVELLEHGQEKTYRCYPTLYFHSLELQPARLADWDDTRKGIAFVQWLRAQLADF